MKLNKSTFSLMFLMVVFTASSQQKKEVDRKAILDMCGCYEVSFKYSETFSPKMDYEKSSDYVASALELALPIVDEEDRISIQHLLLVNDSTVIKHWRQDWLYENQKVFYYNKDNTWTLASLPESEVEGQWTQRVHQVDDGPRYSGSATWVHVDGKHYWENSTDSPLPRREYTKRNDYNVMIRGNRHEITDYGWVHEQDNQKIVRADQAKDQLLAQEKGMNKYTRVSEGRCRPALEWWAEHEGFWTEVRAAWEEVYQGEGALSLAKKVDGKPFYLHLKSLEKSEAGKDEILEVIRKFVQPGEAGLKEASR